VHHRGDEVFNQITADVMAQSPSFCQEWRPVEFASLCSGSPGFSREHVPTHLVGNRGEIALRVIRPAKRWN